MRSNYPLDAFARLISAGFAVWNAFEIRLGSVWQAEHPGRRFTENNNRTNKPAPPSGRLPQRKQTPGWSQNDTYILK